MIVFGSRVRGLRGYFVIQDSSSEYVDGVPSSELVISDSLSDTGSLRKNTQLDADQSASLLTLRLIEQKPFIFIRYGDGAIQCINHFIGNTCDGEVYSTQLGRELLRCWDCVISDGKRAVIGDWLSASFDPRTVKSRHENLYDMLVGDARPHWVHFEALLLMRDTPALRLFYQVVRRDSRRKLLMGPAEWEPAAAILSADFMPISVSAHLFRDHVFGIRDGLSRREFDVLLYGAGMAGNIPVIDHWNRNRDRTYICLGSALDPIYRGRTRFQQLPPNQARGILPA